MNEKETKGKLKAGKRTIERKKTVERNDERKMEMKKAEKAKLERKKKRKNKKQILKKKRNRKTERKNSDLVLSALDSPGERRRNSQPWAKVTAVYSIILPKKPWQSELIKKN